MEVLKVREDDLGPDGPIGRLSQTFFWAHNCVTIISCIRGKEGNGASTTHTAPNAELVIGSNSSILIRSELFILYSTPYVAKKTKTYGKINQKNYHQAVYISKYQDNSMDNLGFKPYKMNN